MTSFGTQNALARAGAREVIWGLRLTEREVARWRALARAIPDPELRADALHALEHKRGNIHGAALFWTLPDRRSPELLRALVAWEVLTDYLDCVSERGAGRGLANGMQLHLALGEALRPSSGALSDYYRHHSSGEDGGYLATLVYSCRKGCARMPSYRPLAPLMARGAELVRSVLALNHEPDPGRRERALEAWAAHELAGAGDLRWFERTAGASAWLTLLALLALAAKPRPRQPEWAADEAAQVYDAYLRSIAPVSAMLDSYGDLAEDREAGHQSYIGLYPSMDEALERLRELVRRARSDAHALPGGSRHGLILACMVAFYLSKDSVRTPELRERTRKLALAGGPLAQALVPVLRGWRAAYGQLSA